MAPGSGPPAYWAASSARKNSPVGSAGKRASCPSSSRPAARGSSTAGSCSASGYRPVPSTGGAAFADPSPPNDTGSLMHLATSAGTLGLYCRRRSPSASSRSGACATASDFFVSTSCNIHLPRLRSATKCFGELFLSSSCLSHRLQRNQNITALTNYGQITKITSISAVQKDLDKENANLMFRAPFVRYRSIPAR